MGFFGNIFSAASHSAALIDAASGSVGGALLSRGKEGPAIEYAVRIPIQKHEGEELSAAMLRALAEVGERLTREGAPALRRKTGSGSVHDVLVSVASPWQETLVHTERVDESKPFTFTRALMRDVVRKTSKDAEGRASSGESVIATRLNGYETGEPFGKVVNLADIIILSSSIDKNVQESIETALRKSYHTKDIRFAAFAPVAYAVFRDVYPHEKDYLVIDVSGEATDIAFVKHGLLASVISLPTGMNHLLRSIGKAAAMNPDMAEPKEKNKVHVIKKSKEGAESAEARAKWVAEIAEGLKGFSEESALPRTIFLLAEEHARDYLRRTLDDAALRSLWLSDDPLSIMPVVPANFLPYVKVGPEGSGDAALMMLGLFHGKSIDDLLA